MRRLTTIKKSGLVAGLSGALVISAPVWASMERLDDQEMSSISGQSGVTAEVDIQATIDTFSYFDDGNGIHLENLRLGSASDPNGQAFHAYDLDLEDDGSLLIGYQIEDRRISVDDIRLDDRPDLSMGAFFMDQTLEGSLRITPGGNLSNDGFTFDSQFNLTDGRFGYRTNGNQIFLDEITMNVDAPGQTLDVADGVVIYELPSVIGDYEIGAIRYAQSSDNFVGDASGLDSYGSITGDFDFSSRYEIQAGGRFGDQGFRIDSQTTLNSANFLYTTDVASVALLGMSGYSRVDDLRIDVAEDWNDRLGLAFTLGQAEGELNIDRIELGDSGSIGSLNLQWLYADGTFNGQAYSNQVFVQGGGHADAGPQGLRLASEWSMVDGRIAYTTNGNPVFVTGIQSWGRGDVTVNVTEEGTQGDTDFYDGLRIGFEDMSGGYRVDGLRVGDDEAEVQGGLELLGLYQAFEYDELNGHVTLGAGGREGEGITINADMMIRNARAGALLNSEGAGVWASDLDYDIHLRDMTVDVTDEGLAIVQGESWSTMDIGNLRIGDKDSGGSFGRIVWQRYETGSEMVISGGGDNNEGLNIALKQIFAEAVSDTKQNSFAWETGRQIVDGQRVNDTGMKLVLSNIHTSDGADLTGEGGISNTFGMQTDITVDVREASQVAGNPLGFSVNSHTRFRELNIGSVDLVHSSANNSTPVLHGISLQNVDIRSNLTATPID